MRRGLSPSTGAKNSCIGAPVHDLYLAGAAYKRYQTIKQQPLTERNGDAHMEDAVPRPVAEPAG